MFFFSETIVSCSRKRFFKVLRISRKHDSGGKQNTFQTSNSGQQRMRFTREVIKNSQYSRLLNALWVTIGMPHNRGRNRSASLTKVHPMS